MVVADCTLICMGVAAAKSGAKGIWLRLLCLCAELLCNSVEGTRYRMKHASKLREREKAVDSHPLTKTRG